MKTSRSTLRRWVHRLSWVLCIVFYLFLLRSAIASVDGWSTPSSARNFASDSDSEVASSVSGRAHAFQLGIYADRSGGGFKTDSGVLQGAGPGLRFSLLWPVIDPCGLVGLTVRRQTLAHDGELETGQSSMRADIWTAGLESDTFWNENEQSSGWMLQGLLVATRSETRSLRPQSETVQSETHFGASLHFSVGYQWVMGSLVRIQFLAGGGRSVWGAPAIWDVGGEGGLRFSF